MQSFVWTLSLGSADFNFMEDGDEWLHLLGKSIDSNSSGYKIGGWSYGSDEPVVTVHLRLGREVVDSCMLVEPRGKRVQFFAAGNSQPDEGLAAVLSNAIQTAARGVGGPKQDHEWTAILVQTATSIGSEPERLEDEVTVGGLRLEPLDLVFHDPVPGPDGSLGLWSVHRCVPIRIHGTSTGYSWHDASQQAARTLRALCGLLALCWNQVYEVAEPATPLNWGMREGRATRPWCLKDRVIDSTEATEWRELKIPEWADNSWETLQTDVQLMAAVDAFLEARYAEERHPSLAAVAYAASIEAVAGKMYKYPRCQQCNSQSGITRGFKAALREVLSENYAAELDSMYSARSKTVHTGHLHGGEVTPGFIMHGIFSGEVTAEYLGKKLPGLRAASTMLLRRALQKGLPQKRPLP